MKLSMKMMEIMNLKVMQLHGDYEPEDGSSAIELTYGHAKDKRYDLKRFLGRGSSLQRNSIKQ